MRLFFDDHPMKRERETIIDQSYWNLSLAFILFFSLYDIAGISSINASRSIAAHVLCVYSRKNEI